MRQNGVCFSTIATERVEYCSSKPPAYNVRTGAAPARASPYVAVGDMQGRGRRHSGRDDAPGMPTADALMALFWHTAFFMGGVMICVFIIAAVKKRRERQQELANPGGFYGRVSAEDEPADAMEAPDPSDREGSALVPKSPAKTEVVELSKVLLELKLERYQRACDQCGYDDWQEIVEMNGGALDTLAARLKLAPNHADRLLQHVRACRLKQQPHVDIGGRQPSSKDDDCVLL